MNRAAEESGSFSGSQRKNPQIPRTTGKTVERVWQGCLHAHLHWLESRQKPGIRQAAGSNGINDENAGLLHGLRGNVVLGIAVREKYYSCAGRLPTRI